MTLAFRTRPLLLAIALACAGNGAAVASGPTAAADAGKAAAALAEARAEMERATRRYAELARTQATHARDQAGDAARHAALARDVQARVLQARNRPVIGVLLAPDDETGVRITGVTPDGPAAKAGLRSGDRLVSVDGTEILGSTGALRIENARKLLGALGTDAPATLAYLRDGRRATARVTPQRDNRVAIFNPADGSMARADGAVFIRTRPDGGFDLDANAIEVERIAGVSPEIHREVTRLVDGEVPRLLSAFRWNGLNLASVDAQLGRYFGTDSGVLVLSAGDIDGLQPGDVIRRVDGQAVATPRDVMDRLRDKREGDSVSVDYLRDRRNGQARVAIPKLMAWPPTPPAPPAPPAPPSPPTPTSSVAPPAPPSPPMPPHPALDANGAVMVGHVYSGPRRD